jgi:hypothetical protein
MRCLIPLAVLATYGQAVWTTSQWNVYADLSLYTVTNPAALAGNYMYRTLTGGPVPARWPNVISAQVVYVTAVEACLPYTTDFNGEGGPWIHVALA